MIKLAVVSQIWIQHLKCDQVIGHCHLRVGSELEPELGGALFTVVDIALKEIERTNYCCISGVYGFQIPDIEGIGLFTVENKEFRIYFLCEGLYSGGIPYLGNKKLIHQVNKLFDRLKQELTNEQCEAGHKLKGDHFWFDLMSSVGLKGQIIVDEIQKVYPLRLLRINMIKDNKKDKYVLRNIEAIKLGSLGHGWKDIDILISTKIEGIFTNPSYSYNIYQVLFSQFKELIPDFRPDTVILTYNNSSRNEVSLLAFLSFSENELNIRFGLPISSGLVFKGEQSIISSLQSGFLNKQ